MRASDFWQGERAEATLGGAKGKQFSPQRHLAVKYRTTCKNSLFLPQNGEMFFAYSSVGGLIVIFKGDEIGNQ
jgi:hypothetical protein